MCICISEVLIFMVFVVVAEMAARTLGGFLVLLSVIVICEAASVFQPITDAHRSAALELFKPSDGSFGRWIFSLSWILISPFLGILFILFSRFLVWLSRIWNFSNLVGWIELNDTLSGFASFLCLISIFLFCFLAFCSIWFGVVDLVFILVIVVFLISSSVILSKRILTIWFDINFVPV